MLFMHICLHIYTLYTLLKHESNTTVFVFLIINVQRGQLELELKVNSWNELKLNDGIEIILLYNLHV